MVVVKTIVLRQVLFLRVRKKGRHKGIYNGDIYIGREPITCKDKQDVSKFTVRIHEHKCKEERGNIYVGNRVAITQSGKYLKYNSNSLIQTLDKVIRTRQYPDRVQGKDLKELVDKVISNDDPESKLMNPNILFEVKQINRCSQISALDTFDLRQLDNMNAYYLVNEDSRFCLDPKTNTFFMSEVADVSLRVFLEPYSLTEGNAVESISETTPFLLRTYQGKYIYWIHEDTNDKYELIVQTEKPPSEYCVHLFNATLSVNPFPPHCPNFLPIEDIEDEERVRRSDKLSKWVVPTSISDIFQSRMDTKLSQAYQHTSYNQILTISIPLLKYDYFTKRYIERVLIYSNTANNCQYIKCFEKLLPMEVLPKELLHCEDRYCLDDEFRMLLLKAGQAVTQGVVNSHSSSTSCLDLPFSPYCKFAQEKQIRYGLLCWVVYMICFPLTFYPYEDVGNESKQAIIATLRAQEGLMQLLNIKDINEMLKTGVDWGNEKHKYLFIIVRNITSCDQESSKELLQAEIYKFLTCAYNALSITELRENFPVEEILDFFDDKNIRCDAKGMMFRIFIRVYPDLAMTKVEEILLEDRDNSFNDCLLVALQHLGASQNEGSNPDHPNEQGMLLGSVSNTVQVYTKLLDKTSTKKFEVSPGSTSIYKGFEYSLQVEAANQAIHKQVYSTVAHEQEMGDHFFRSLREEENHLPYWREITENEIVLTILQFTQLFSFCTDCKTTDYSPVTHCDKERRRVSLCDIDRDIVDTFFISLVNCFLCRYDLYKRTHLSQTLLKYILQFNENYDCNTGDLKLPTFVEISADLLEIREVVAEEFPKAITYACFTQNVKEGYDLQRLYEACCRLTEIVEPSQIESEDSKTEKIKKSIICHNLHQQLILLIVRIRDLVTYSRIEEVRIKSIHAICSQIYQFLTTMIHDDPKSAETIWRYKSSLFTLDHWENSPELNELAANFACKCISTVSVWNYTHSDCDLAHSALAKWGVHVTQLNGFKEGDLSKLTKDDIIDQLTKDSIDKGRFEICAYQQDVTNTQEENKLLEVLHHYNKSEDGKLKPAYFVKWILDFIAGNTTEYNDVETITQTARQLLLFLKDEKLGKDSEIILVLVSEESLNYLINWTLAKDHESTHFSRPLKCIVLEILCIVVKLDYEKTSAHIVDMLKCQYFRQNFLIFCEGTILTYVRCLEHHDKEAVSSYWESSNANGDILNRLLKFLKILCSNNAWIRGHLSKQDGIFKSHNILEPVIGIVKHSKYTLSVPGVSNACVAALRLIVTMIDGEQSYNEDSIIAERIIDEAKFILSIGTYGPEGQFYDLQFEELKIEDVTVPTSNLDIALLKYNCLLILKSLMHRDKVDFNSMLNRDILSSNMKVIYQQVKVKRNLNYTQGLFNNLSKTHEENAKNEVLFIENGFMTYFIFSQVFKNSSEKEHNIVQTIDKNGFLAECRKLLLDSWFAFKSMFTTNSVLLSNQDFDANSQDEARIFFDQHSSHIELNIKNKLETEYFYIDPTYIYFNQEEKDSIWYSADLDDAKAFCASIKEKFKQKLEELKNKERLCYSLVVGQFNKRTKIFRSLTTLLILFINLCILLAFTDRNIDEFEDLTLFGLDQSGSEAIIKTVGGLILLYILFISISIVKLYYWKTKEIKVTAHSSSGKPRHTGKCAKGCRLGSHLILSGLKSFFECIIFMELWFHLLLIAICILGLAYNDLFFSLTLLYVIYRTEKIMEVIQAVWIPRHRILYTLILTVIAIYLFAIFALAFLFRDFDANLSGSCNGAFSCFVTIYDQWYKSDIGGFLDNNYAALTRGEEQYNPTFLRIFFDSIVFLILAVLLINIVGGLIIDTFSSIRGARESLLEKQRETCYVCGKTNQEIPDFDYHTKFIHNLWDYMYYIGYIMNKKVLETHIERIMKKMIENDDWTFFPCYANEDTLVERTMTTMKDDIIKTLKGDIQKANEKVDKNSEEMKSLKTEMSDIKTSFKKLIENSARNN